MGKQITRDWWEQLETQLGSEQTKFAAWLADWDFFNAFSRLDLSDHEEKEIDRILKTLELVSKRLEGRAKPSSTLLDGFAHAKGNPTSMALFVREHYFGAWAI